MKRPSHGTVWDKSFVAQLLAEPGAVSLLPCLASCWRGDTKSDRQETRVSDFGSSEKQHPSFRRGKRSNETSFEAQRVFLNCNKKPSPKTYSWVAFKDVLTPFYTLFSFSFFTLLCLSGGRAASVIIPETSVHSSSLLFGCRDWKKPGARWIYGEKPLVPSRVPWFPGAPSIFGFW